MLSINISWNITLKKDRTEVFNLRNSKAQETFFKNTTEMNILYKILENRDAITGGKNWVKSLKSIIVKSFTKIRITDNKKEDHEVQKLLNRRDSSQESLDEIANAIYVRNRNVILDQISRMTDVDGSFCRQKMWKVK